MAQQKLVKSKNRVIDFGEVFTPTNIVNDMLNTFANEIIPKEMTFLEPACGEGVFLIEILKRKLKGIDSAKDSVWCVSSLYGIDIQKDNVKNTKENLLNVWKEWNNGRYDVENAIQNILNANIILGDFLDGKNIEITEYEFSEETDDVVIKIEKINDMIGEEVKIMSFFEKNDEIIKKYWQI